jgi:hypothetical protein
MTREQLIRALGTPEHPTPAAKAANIWNAAPRRSARDPRMGECLGLPPGYKRQEPIFRSKQRHTRTYTLDRICRNEAARYRDPAAAIIGDLIWLAIAIIVGAVAWLLS